MLYEKYYSKFIYSIFPIEKDSKLEMAFCQNNNICNISHLHRHVRKWLSIVFLNSIATFHKKHSKAIIIQSRKITDGNRRYRKLSITGNNAHIFLNTLQLLVISYFFLVLFFGEKEVEIHCYGK